MNKLKKILALCLALVMLLALAACGRNGSSNAGSTNGSAADISGTVLLDNDGVKVTVEKMDYYETEDQKMLRVNIQNDQDQDLTVRATLVSVNGYMDANPYFVTYNGDARNLGQSWEVPANSNGDNYGLIFSMSTLEKAGVTEIGDVEMTVVVTGDGFEEELVGSPVSLHVADVSQTYNDEGTVVVDNDQAKIVVMGVEQDEYMGPTAIIYVYNKGGEAIGMNMDNVVVDGTEAFAFYGTEIAPGKRDVSFCAFEGMNEATGIQELKCTFTGFTMDGDELFTTEEVTVTF